MTKFVVRAAAMVVLPPLRTAANLKPQRSHGEYQISSRRNLYASRLMMSHQGANQAVEHLIILAQRAPLHLIEIRSGERRPTA
jgi:hypothetical protein